MWALLGNSRTSTWYVTLLENFTMIVRSALIQRILSIPIQLLESTSRTWSVTQYNLLCKWDLLFSPLVDHWHSYYLSPLVPLFLGISSRKHLLNLQALLAYVVFMISIRSSLPLFINSCNTYMSNQHCHHSHIQLG